MRSQHARPFCPTIMLVRSAGKEPGGIRISQQARITERQRAKQTHPQYSREKHSEDNRGGNGSVGLERLNQVRKNEGTAVAIMSVVRPQPFALCSVDIQRQDQLSTPYSSLMNLMSHHRLDLSTTATSAIARSDSHDPHSMARPVLSPIHPDVIQFHPIDMDHLVDNVAAGKTLPCAGAVGPTASPQSRNSTENIKLWQR